MPSTENKGPPCRRGWEKESRELGSRNGIRLPTALELIAKINIHYCNYFLRRGCAEGESREREERAKGSLAIEGPARETGGDKEGG